LDIQPEGLDLDSAGGLGDNDDDIDNNFHACIDGDPDQNPDADEPGAEDEVKNLEPEEQGRPLAF
ncbi:hypothetical protein FRC07_004271, partial [Ceratobasidium sp. 392]